MVGAAEIIYGASALLGLSALATTLRNYRKRRPLSHKIYMDKHEALVDVVKLIKNSGGETLWTIAGELDPKFYNKVKGLIVEQIRNNGMKFMAIAGPNICIESDLIDKIGRDKESGGLEYWQAHPVLEIVRKFHATGQAFLYLRKKGESSYETHAFCSTQRDSACITERAHIELAPSPVLVEEGTRVGYEDMYEIFQERIKSDRVELWKPDSPDAGKIVERFRKYSKFDEEAKYIRKLYGYPSAETTG